MKRSLSFKDFMQVFVKIYLNCTDCTTNMEREFILNDLKTFYTKKETIKFLDEISPITEFTIIGDEIYCEHCAKKRC